MNEPHRFLAYNNGLTATAQSVAFGSDGHTIVRAHDLQIVNGGQTTASIFHAKRLKADLGQVWVQVKLSVVSNPQQLDDFVGKVAQYANSQNKINLADFSANSPFHRAVEKYSRTIWAPAVGNAQNQTRWFYERARGQYADASSRAGTPAKIKAWQAIHPKTQMFTKTDLAKFENTWNQKPHMVSKGAQTNFGEFTVELSARPDFSPSERYFQHLIAKAILFRRAEKIVGDQKFGGYRANIVAYTLAYIFYKTAQRIDLDAVWKRQKVPLSLESTIEKVSHHVYQHITTASGGANVTQFCKQEKCWRLLREKELHLSSELEAELIAVGRAVAAPRPAPDDALSSPSEIDVQNIVDAGQIEADLWFAASKWAARTNNLQGWQRSLLFSIGKLRSSGRDVSAKQATQGLKAIREVQELGFENILHGLE